MFNSYRVGALQILCEAYQLIVRSQQCVALEEDIRLLTSTWHFGVSSRPSGTGAVTVSRLVPVFHLRILYGGNHEFDIIL